MTIAARSSTPLPGLRIVSAAAAMVAALALVVAGLGVAAYNESQFRAQASREAQVQADILAASVTAALTFDDEAAAREYLDALRANPQVEAAGLYGANGALRSAYRREAEQPVPERAEPLGTVRHGRRIVVTAPVTQAGARLGSVYLRTQAEPAWRRALRYAAIGLLGVMASLVAVVLGMANAAQRRANLALAEANEALRLQIQQREKAEEALRQSQKMEAMGQLTGGVAHDFNNLLMVASSGLDLIDRTDDPARRETLKQAIRQALDRGAGLTRQLLAFSRRSPLKSEVVDLGEQIEGMHLLLERSLREDIAVRMEASTGLWPVEVDPAQLEVAVLNIAVNARDAMPSGGVLTLRAHNRQRLEVEGARRDFVELSISDTGTGMDAETVRRVFEPFFTTKDVGKGTGLGLSQVYGFCRASGGVAQIASEPGKGATISLLFPRSDKALTRATPPSQAAGGPLAPGCVLLVEDDESVAAAVTDMLHELGYRVLRARDAAEALSLIERNQDTVDIVFSDMVMPGGMDGAALADEIMRRRPGLPVVLTTGFSEAAEAAAQKGLRLLAKPYRLDSLAAELAAARAAAKRRV